MCLMSKRVKDNMGLGFNEFKSTILMTHLPTFTVGNLNQMLGL